MSPDAENARAPEDGGVLVTVVIPFYKGRDFLPDALQSAANQTVRDIEVIVVDDGSDEDISDIVAEYKKDARFSFIRQENAGASAARNRGIDNARGKFIAFLDADDIWLPNKLEKQLEYLRQTGCMWAHCAYNEFVDGNRQKKTYASCKIFGDVYPLIFWWSPMFPSCSIFRREVFDDKSLRYPVGKSYGEDIVLWKAVGLKFNLGYLPDPLTEVRLRVTKNKIGNAAYRGEVQMGERAHLLKTWRFVRQHSSLPLFAVWLFATLISAAGIKCYKALSKPIRNEVAKELLARALYLPSYVIFKGTSFLLRLRQRFNTDKP